MFPFTWLLQNCWGKVRGNVVDWHKGGLTAKKKNAEWVYLWLASGGFTDGPTF